MGKCSSVLSHRPHLWRTCRHLQARTWRWEDGFETAKQQRDRASKNELKAHYLPLLPPTHAHSHSPLHPQHTFNSTHKKSQVTFQNNLTLFTDSVFSVLSLPENLLMMQQYEQVTRNQRLSSLFPELCLLIFHCIHLNQVLAPVEWWAMLNHSKESSASFNFPQIQ